MREYLACFSRLISYSYGKIHRYTNKVKNKKYYFKDRRKV